MARLTGKDAALYLYVSSSWTYAADIYDWTADTDLALLECRIKGDGAMRHMASHTSGRLSAKRYAEVSGTLALGELLTPGTRLDFAVVIRDPALFAQSGAPDPTTFSGNASGKIQGTGYVTKSHVNAPRGLATDEFELTYDTVPVIT